MVAKTTYAGTTGTARVRASDGSKFCLAGHLSLPLQDGRDGAQRSPAEMPQLITRQKRLCREFDGDSFAQTDWAANRTITLALPREEDRTNHVSCSHPVYRASYSAGRRKGLRPRLRRFRTSLCAYARLPR